MNSQSAAAVADVKTTDTEIHWQRNLWVCVFGAFTTVMAMTLLLPFLPLYVEQLGVHGHGAIARWSAVLYGATFLVAGAAAPVWGRVADRYGRKILLVRASLGMAVCMGLIGMVHSVWQLLALRLLAGLLGGYASGATIVVATQTPNARASWALGMLSSGVMSGVLLGPLLGGVMPGLIGIRATFFVAGGVIFVAFLATVFLVREAPRTRTQSVPRGRAWPMIVDRRGVLTILLISLLTTLANFSIEPVITLFVAELSVPPSQVVFISGLSLAATALGAIVSAPRIGRLADRIGRRHVLTWGLVACAVLLVPQGFVTAAWQLVALRFLMGIAMAGLQPSLTALLRQAVPTEIAGGVLAWGVTTQYLGQVAGPLFGAWVDGYAGMRPVFWATAVLMVLGVLSVRFVPRPAP